MQLLFRRSQLALASDMKPVGSLMLYNAAEANSMGSSGA